MGSNKQQLLKNFVTTQLQNAKQQTQPIVNSDGFKNGEPPAGSNWRIPGDTLYNPTPYPIKAVSDNGITKTLNPFDETNVQFPGAQYVDEYKMKFGGLPKYQTGEEVIPTRYPVIRVTDPNDSKYLEYQKLKRLNEWSNIQDTDFKKVLLDSYLKGSEDPYYVGNISDSKEIFKTINNIEPSFFDEDPRVLSMYFTDDIGNYGSKKEVKNFKTKKELDKFLSSRKKGEFEYAPYNGLFYKDDLAPLIKKYKPVGYQYSNEFSKPTNRYTYRLKNKKWTAPENQILEDEINRDLIKQIYPTFTDKELDDGIIYRRHEPIYTTNLLYDDNINTKFFYISDEHGIENLKGTNYLPKILKAKNSDWVPKGTTGYLPESIVEDFHSNYTYFPMFGTPESYLGSTYEYDALPHIPMKEATKLPISSPQLKLTSISSNASPFTNMEPLYMDLTDSDYAKVPTNLRMDVEQPMEGQRGLRNKVRYGYKDKDGIVYYEKGVPGTPGYQGRFSGRPLTSKYHFVDELYPKTESSDLVTRKDGGPAKGKEYKTPTGESIYLDPNFKKNGGLHQYQKAGLTFEELMMQGMRPQSTVSDATYYTNAQIQDAGKGESVEQKQKQAALSKRLKDEEIRKKKEALKAENNRLKKEADARASAWFGTNINSDDYVEGKDGNLRKITDKERQVREELTNSNLQNRATHLVDKQNQTLSQDINDFAEEAIPALAFEAAPYLLPFVGKAGLQGLKSGMQGLSDAKKGTKNFLIAKQFSNQVNKAVLPTEAPLQKLTARIDPIGRSSVNVENDIIKTYGRDNYERAIDDLYARYHEAYNAPYIEFKSSRPSSMFEGIGSADYWPEGRLLKRRFCETGSECAKTSNAVTSKVYSEITGQPFATNENAHNAWHLEDQMTRHGGRNVTNEVLQNGEFRIGDRILMGNGVDQSTYVPGYVADPSVRHAGVFAGYMPTENGLVPMLLESGATNPLFLNPVGHTITGPGSLRQVIRPQQFLDDTFAKGLVDKNVRYAFRDKPSVATYSSQNPKVQSILDEAEQHRERIKRTHDLTNDEFDELLNSLIGIGAQETKLNAALPSPFLPAAKVKLQNALVDAGLTAPIKKTINVGKRIGNAVTSKGSSLPEYPGTSFIEMESAKLAESQNIPFSEALQIVKGQYQPKPRFTPSTVEPSKGMFRQKFQTEAGKTSGFNTDITQDELANGLSQMSENYARIKQLYPDASPRDLINLTTLMWNSPGKAQNKELVDFFLFGKGNPNPSKFKFDYLDKVNRYRDQLINVHPQSVEPVHREFFRAGYPEIQYQKGGSVLSNFVMSQLQNKQ